MARVKSKFRAKLRCKCPSHTIHQRRRWAYLCGADSDLTACTTCDSTSWEHSLRASHKRRKLRCKCPSHTIHQRRRWAYLCGPDSDLTACTTCDSTSWEQSLRVSHKRRCLSARLNKRVYQRQTVFPRPIIHTALGWHLSQANRQVNGFIGRSEKICEGPKIPKNVTPAQHKSILVNNGYEVIKQHSVRPTLITDEGGTVIAMVVPPKLEQNALDHIHLRMMKLCHSAGKTAGKARGNFAILEAGLQKGGGSRHPTPRSCPSKEAKNAALEFLRSKSVGRLLHDAGANFQQYFPKLEEYYQSVAEGVAQVFDDCELPVPGLSLTSITLNVGKKCICRAHIDGQNLAFGLCLICPIGKFNHEAGGYLILHELKLILEAAPGSMIFIPSAIITHENIGVGIEETRQAITAYTPGSYFQYYEEGFGNVPRRTPQHAAAIGTFRWHTGIGLLPHVNEHL